MTSEQISVIREHNPFLSLSEIIYDLLLSEIVSFSVKPGTKISENELSKELGISRSPIKSALVRLENEGYVVLQNSRYYVGRMTPKEFGEICTMTRLLERQAAREAAERISDEELKALYAKAYKLRTLYKKLIGNSDISIFNTLLQAEVDFHCSLVRMSGNALLIEVHSKLEHKIFRSRSYLIFSRDLNSLSEADFDHVYLCDVLRYHDPDMADAAMCRHLMLARKGIDELCIFSQ